MKKQNVSEILCMREEEWEEPDWQSAAKKDYLGEKTGELPYRMTNAYLFRLLFQRKPRVLKTFLRILFAIPDHVPVSVRIQNPIAMGERIIGKKTSMVLWVRASGIWEGNVKLRMFDDCMRGKDSLQITFRKEQRTGSEQGMQVVQMQTLDLPCLAKKQEETSTSLVGYARLFTAGTWEELKDISLFSDVLLEASQTIAEVLEMPDISLRCMEREVAAAVENWKKKENTKEIGNNLSYCQKLLAQQNKLLLKQQKALAGRP